jgi:4-hydroxybenzoate polyprenyltransferase
MSGATTFPVHNAGVAKWQTQRTQNASGKPVRVRIPLPAPALENWRRLGKFSRSGEPHSLRPTRRQVLRGYLVLPHAVPIAVVMSATAAFAVVAAGGWPGLGQLACLLGAMFGAQLAIGAVNELVDADLDAIAKPEKPIPAGLVSRRGARIVAISGLILMAAFSTRFRIEAFLLCAFGAGVGVAYSLWFKRTIWSWIPYLVALPLLPIWVWTALGSVEPGLFAIYPIGAAAVVAIQIAQSLPDIEADRDSGVKTLAVVLGPSRARRACWAAMIVAALLATGLALWLTEHPVRVWLAAFVACALVGLNVTIWKRNPRSGALACFPCVAIGAVALGVGWAAALVSR